MIAQRFRPVGWVAGVAAAACALYMISLQVASERGQLEEIEHKIASTKRDIRSLQTELGTRASLRQLERWNGEVLALSAPGAGQYLSGEQALATIDKSKLGPASAAPPPVMMAVMAADADVPEPEKPILEKITTPSPPPKPLTKADRVVQAAIADRPATASVKSDKPKLAMNDKKLLDSKALGDVSRKAKAEASKADRKP
jgi:hypothetical protein